MNGTYSINRSFSAKEMLEFKHSNMTLGEYIRHIEGRLDINNPRLHNSILNLCSRVTGSDPIKTMSTNRDDDAVFARYMTMFFMKRLDQQGELKRKFSLSRLGKVSGGKHHATVMWGIKTVENVIDVKDGNDVRTLWFYAALGKVENGLNLTLKIK